MAITVTPKGAKADDGNFGSLGTTHTITGAALGTGDIVVFIIGDNNTAGVRSVTVDGVTATQIGTSADDQAFAWIAQGVNNATGNIVLGHSFGWNLESANWFLITGHNAASATFTYTSLISANGNDPQSVSGTIPSGGVGLISIAAYTLAGGNINPTTWVGCVASGNTTLEDFVATGNKMSIAGNYSTTAGTGPFTASGNNTYASQNLEIMMVTFSATGGDTLFAGGGIHFI